MNYFFKNNVNCLCGKSYDKKNIVGGGRKFGF